MNIELQEKKIVDIIKDNLEILKTVDDKKVKESIIQIEFAIKKYDEILAEEPSPLEAVITEEIKEEPKNIAPVEDIVVAEPKPVEVKEAPKPTVETSTVGDIQLSMQVANKLKEAAIELESKEVSLNEKAIELQAVKEIVEGYKNKVLELNDNIGNYKIELAAYKKKEELELQNQKSSITNDLIELYANLNIVKTHDELQVFGLSQLVELRKALGVTLEKKNTPVRETVNSSTITSVKQHTQRDSKPKETFEGLFGKNPEMY